MNVSKYLINGLIKEWINELMNKWNKVGAISRGQTMQHLLDHVREFGFCPRNMGSHQRVINRCLAFMDVAQRFLHWLWNLNSIPLRSFLIHRVAHITMHKPSSTVLLQMCPPHLQSSTYCWRSLTVWKLLALSNRQIIVGRQGIIVHWLVKVSDFYDIITLWKNNISPNI